MNFDLVTLGRVSMDLFSNNIGAPFSEIEAFETSVGGSPSNIAIGSARLGLQVAAVTAVGEDKVGDFVIDYLQGENVDTQFIPRKADTKTGLAVVGVEPPDRFPLVFYRDNPADIHITIDDINRVPIVKSRALLLSGTALSRGTCRDATLYAAEIAQHGQTIVFMDLDLRVDQWSHVYAFGVNVRTVVPSVDVLIGTEEEFYFALSTQISESTSAKSLTESEHEQLRSNLQQLLTRHPHLTLVVKRGARGVSILQHNQADEDVSGFAVEVINTVGAGDAFASGLIFGRLQGWDWYKSARLANACGALVVTRNGCSKAMPYHDEIMTFIETHGGF